MSQTERQYREEVVLSEANGHQSRETITVVSGQNLKAGAVIGKITASGKYAVADNVTPASNGSQVASAVLLEDADASGGDVAALALVRNCEVKAPYLTYMAGSSGANKTAQNVNLAAAGVGIIVR